MKNLRKRWIIWLGLGLVLVCLVSQLSRCKLPVTDPPPGKIAFVSDRSGSDQIYVMDTDGSNVTRLTWSEANNFAPEWSPDGRYIAFTSHSDDVWAVHVVDTDGAHPVNLINGLDDAWRPTWSPDSQYVVFSAEQDDNVEVYVAAIDGSSLVNVSNHPAEDTYPSWSPNGNRLVFSSDRGSNEGIYVVNADGSGLIRLTPGHWTGDLCCWIWSPDGRKVAFSLDGDGEGGIYVVNSDGSNLVCLRQGWAYYGVGWSPDGRRLLFTTATEIHVMNSDGSNAVRLTQPPPSNHDSTFSWSPDGRHIAFVRWGFESAGFYLVPNALYVMDSDGSHVTRLSGKWYGSFGGGYSWSPDGRHLAFGYERNSEIYIVSVDGRYRSRLTRNDDDDYYPVWQPQMP